MPRIVLAISTSSPPTPAWRLGELRALRWRDIDFSKRLIHARRAFASGREDTPKSGRARAVPMIDQVLTELDTLSRRAEHAGDDDLVLVSPDGVHPRTPRCADASTPRWTPLRSSPCASMTCATPSAPSPCRSSRCLTSRTYMGHADIATTMLYVHHVPQHDAAAKLSAAVMQARAAVGWASTRLA